MTRYEYLYFENRVTQYDYLCCTLKSLLDVHLPIPKLDDLERDEQRVAIAVHELTGLTAEQWAQLSRVEREPWLERAIAKRRAEPTPSIPGASRAVVVEGLDDELVTADADEQAEPTGMTWQEAAERLENLRSQGEPFTSYRKLGTTIGCVESTVHKAVKRTPSLQSWPESKPAAARRAVSFNPDNPEVAAAESRLAAAADDVMEQTYEAIDRRVDAQQFSIESASKTMQAAYYRLPEAARPWFLKLSDEDRREYLDDPDQFQKILGRHA